MICFITFLNAQFDHLRAKMNPRRAEDQSEN